MKSIILCYPELTSREAQLPIGLYKIASFCSKKFKVHIIDARLEPASPRIHEILSKEDVLFLGLSVMTGQQITSALKYSQEFHSRTSIVWGGLHPTITPHQTITNPYIDYIVVGEGEKQILQLATHLSNASDKRPQIVGFSTPPFTHSFFEQFAEHGPIPYIDMEIPKQYFTSRDGFTRALSLETSRGCPFSCKFCHNSIAHPPYRTCSSATICASISSIKEKYQIDGVIFQEDLFFANKKRAIETLPHIKELNIKWKANARISQIVSNPIDFWRNINSFGCQTIQLGAESGSDSILKLIDKKITKLEIEIASDTLLKSQIRSRFNFIIGFPGETKQQIQKTIDLANKLQDTNPLTTPPFLNIYTPYPGTKLYTLAIKEGFIPPNKLEEWANINWNLPSPSLHKHLSDFLVEASNSFLQKNPYSKFITG